MNVYLSREIKLLVFVLRNFDSMDDHLYFVDPLTCTECDFSILVCRVGTSPVHPILMTGFHVGSKTALAPGLRDS